LLVAEDLFLIADDFLLVADDPFLVADDFFELLLVAGNRVELLLIGQDLVLIAQNCLLIGDNFVRHVKHPLSQLVERRRGDAMIRRGEKSASDVPGRYES
jgi:hypothetical protein